MLPPHEKIIGPLENEIVELRSRYQRIPIVIGRTSVVTPLCLPCI